MPRGRFERQNQPENRANGTASRRPTNSRGRSRRALELHDLSSARAGNSVVPRVSRIAREAADNPEHQPDRSQREFPTVVAAGGDGKQQRGNRTGDKTSCNDRSHWRAHPAYRGTANPTTAVVDPPLHCFYYVLVAITSAVRQILCRLCSLRGGSRGGCVRVAERIEKDWGQLVHRTECRARRRAPRAKPVCHEPIEDCLTAANDVHGHIP
jgi:hypothetical protein